VAPALTRLTIDQLGAARALNMDAEGIRSLGTWGPGPSGVWEDVEFVARLFLAVDPDDAEQQALRWHHLLVAVGNFKRSTGPIVPTRLPPGLGTFISPTKFNYPLPTGGQATILVDDQDSWRLLTEVDGLGVATATAVLSAIWPGDHVIVDERDSRAAVALHCGLNFSGSALDAANFPKTDTHTAYWDLYPWFLKVVRVTAAHAGCSPVQVERALYRLDMKVLDDLPADWRTNGSWSEYESVARTYVGYSNIE
jgi:hypothetical protein